MQIERASRDFVKSLEMALARKEDLRDIFDAKESECIDVEFKTLAFIQRERQSYAESR